jgi:hypothetical protein
MLHHHVSFFDTAAAGEASRDPNTFKIVFLGEEFQFSLFPDFSSHSLAEMFCRWWQRIFAFNLHMHSAKRIFQIVVTCLNSTQRKRTRKELRAGRERDDREFRS